MTICQPLADGVTQESLAAERPYPLRRRFFIYVLPALCVTMTGLLIVFSHALTSSVERFYEGSTARRHHRIAHTVARTTPTLAGPRAEAELAVQADHSNFRCLAILTLDGEIRAQYGRCPALSASELVSLRASQNLFRTTSGRRVMWIVANTVRPRPEGERVIMVSARGAVGAERRIGRNTMAWVSELGAALVAALVLATALISRAQREINQRARALSEVRSTLARFISRHTHERALHGPLTAVRRTVTVLFLDIRDFSTFADTSAPETAADLVSTIASISFVAILAHNGDVDRLIGDGLVARFDGPERRTNAWRAAQKILGDLERLSLPREVGLGLHDGVVVDATIGDAERSDATILGRTVNVASRLCGAAAPGELVVSNAMLPMPADVALRPHGMDFMYLKGHREPLSVHRFGSPHNHGALSSPTADARRPATVD